MFSSHPSELSVAVVGMACKFPGADSLEEFWDILRAGHVQCRDLPTDRFPESRFKRRRGVQKFKGNMINDIDAFDHKFFHVASREARFMDPQQRLALQVVYQALESADYFTNDVQDRNKDIGCYLATSATEYHSDNVNSQPLSAFSLTGSIRPFIAGKVSHHFGWTGPAIMFDTACSGSATAIHHACRAVLSGDCTSAVAGATNLFVSPDAFQELAAGHFLSPTGASKSFDASADGYCRGEGVAFVMLKKLSAAIQDGDLIRGVIASTAVGQNANQTTITIPHGPSQMSLYRKALGLARLDPVDITYVEGHGTGTPVGDPIELESIRNVFGDPSPAHRSTKTYLGSVKSNIGHSEASSGIAALIKVLLMLQKETIPQQAMFRNLNPTVAPLEPSNIEIPVENIPWISSASRNACVNNYGASGTNAVMIVTQPPGAIPSLQLMPVTTFPVLISAFSPTSLKSYCTTLMGFINTLPNGDAVKDVAYHLSRRRNFDLDYSASATISTTQELMGFLASTIVQQSWTKQVRQQPLVLFFGGQSGDSISISRTLYDSSIVFRKYLDHCDAVIMSLGVPSILSAIFDPRPCDDVVSSHSMLFSVQYASAMAWIDCGLQPTRLVGHSFGQLTALCVSGVLSVDEGLKLIVRRADLIKTLWTIDSGAMIAIEAQLSQVTQLLSSQSHLGIEIACFNGPQDFVLAGHSSAIETLETTLEASKEHFRWKKLQVTHAFHSVLTEPLLEPLREILQSFTFREPKIPLETCTKNSTWSFVTAELVAAHIREPVYFHHAIARICEQLGPCTWLEAGSTSSAPMLRRALRHQSPANDITSVNLNSASVPDALARATAELWKRGVQVQFWPFHKSHQYQYRMLNLPPYQFDKTRHWLDYLGSATPSVEVQPRNQKGTPLVQPTRMDQSGGEFRINRKHEDWLASCSGYQISGVPVCPTSLLLGVVFQAIGTVRQSPAQQDSEFRIRNWKMQSLIPASSDVDLHLTISKSNSPSSWEFLFRDASDVKNELAAGIVSTNSEHCKEDFACFQRFANVGNIKRISVDDESDSVSGSAVYRILSNFSHIPKARHMINRVSIKSKEAVGYLQPSVIDSSLAIDDFIRVPFVCLNGLRDRQNDHQIYLPTGVGQVQYMAPVCSASSKGNSWAVYVKFVELDGAKTICDVFAFDLYDGQLFATLLDLTFTRTPAGSSQAGPEVPLTNSRHVANNDESFRVTLEQAGLTATATKHSITSSPMGTSAQLDDQPDLLEELFNLFVRVADVDRESLSIDATILDLGVDSLMGMEIAEEINNFFSVDFGVEELALAPDIGSLCGLIASRATGFSFHAKAGSTTSSNDENISQSSTSTGTDSSIATSVACSMQSSGVNKGVTLTDHPVSPSPCSINGHQDVMLKAFNTVREKFDDFAIANGCDNFMSEIYPLQVELVVAYVTEALAKLGCDLSLIQVGESIPDIPHASRYDKFMARMMHALDDNGLVKRDGHGWIRTSKPVPPRLASAEILARLLADFPHFANENKLIDMVGRKLDECLTGRVNPLALLFGGPEKRQMMADQYTTAPLQHAASQQLATFIEQCFCSQKRCQPLRVLEIGGGTCGTSVRALDKFAQLDIPVEYVFSDISPSFVIAAKTKLKGHNFVKFQALDIMAEPHPDLLGSFDMIIATNVIHATPDVYKSAGNARRMLRPGGFMTLTEYTDPLYTADLVFGQLDGWWLFEDGRSHAMMDEHKWDATLKQAGFQHVDWTDGKTKESQILRIFLAY